MRLAEIVMEAIRMVGPYPEEGTPFYLPTSVIEFYDDPYFGLGDEGYDVETLKVEIAQDGDVMYCIQVAKSIHQIEHHNDHSVYAFNGNHRLAAAKELGLPRIICENSGADDAEQLTVEEILKLGGSFA